MPSGEVWACSFTTALEFLFKTLNFYCITNRNQILVVHHDFRKRLMKEHLKPRKRLLCHLLCDSQRDRMCFYESGLLNTIEYTTGTPR